MATKKLTSDQKRVQRLREFYRENFANGESDEAFLCWIETCLQDIEDNNSAD